MVDLYRCQVVLPYGSGLPEDVSTNTFYTEVADTDGLTAFLAGLVAFYNDSYGGSGHGLSYYISEYISRDTDACKIRVYDMGDPEPRPLLLEQPFSLAEDGDTSSLPLEVSLCNSYKAIGASNPRKRGRVFIGPLGLVSLNSNGGPSTPLIQAMAAAAEALQAGGSGPDPYTWVGYSQAAGLPFVIHDGWVDNEFDTQRRRQIRATDRTTWTV